MRSNSLQIYIKFWCVLLLLQHYQECIDYFDAFLATSHAFLAAFNIESINGYHPAKLSIYESFNSVPLINRLKMFNVKYLILSNEVNIPMLKLVKTGSYFSNLSYRKVFLYEYLDFYPRVQFLEKINKVNSRLEGYQKLNSELFDFYLVNLL